MTTSHDREIGSLGARLDGVEEALKELRVDVREVRDTLNQARGGWRIMMAVGGAGGIIGGFMTKFMPWFWGGTN